MDDTGRENDVVPNKHQQLSTPPDRYSESDDGSGSRSPEVREWKEGEQYDSDEYEVVEVEVSATESENDSEVNDTPENIETFHVREPLKLRFMSDNEDSGMQTISDSDNNEEDRNYNNNGKTRSVKQNIEAFKDEGVSLRTPSPKSTDLKLNTSINTFSSSDRSPGSRNSSVLSSPRHPLSPVTKSPSSRFSNQNSTTGSSLSSPRTPSSPSLRSPLSKYGDRSPSLGSNYKSRLTPTSPNLSYQRPGSPNVKKICPKAYSAVDSFFK